MGARTKAANRGIGVYTSGSKRLTRVENLWEKGSGQEQALSKKRKVNEGEGGGVHSSGKKGCLAEVDLGRA